METNQQIIGALEGGRGIGQRYGYGGDSNGLFFDPRRSAGEPTEEASGTNWAVGGTGIRRVVYLFHGTWGQGDSDELSSLQVVWIFEVRIEITDFFG